MQIKIIIEPKFSKKWPNLKIKVNSKTMFDDVCMPNKEKYFVYDTSLENMNELNHLEIIHHGKSGDDTVVDKEGNVIDDRAIILKSIEFDNYAVPEVLLYENKFFPDWPDQPENIKNNLYFGFNGTYRLEFINDAKKMYFNNLLEKESLANINNKKIVQLPSGKEIESFEFNGELVDSEKKDNVTIDDLYKAVTK